MACIAMRRMLITMSATYFMLNKVVTVAVGVRNTVFMMSIDMHKMRIFHFSMAIAGNICPGKLHWHNEHH
jgi:hypothetical protein